MPSGLLVRLHYLLSFEGRIPGSSNRILGYIGFKNSELSAFCSLILLPDCHTALRKRRSQTHRSTFIWAWFLPPWRYKSLVLKFLLVQRLLLKSLRRLLEAVESLSHVAHQCTLYRLQNMFLLGPSRRTLINSICHDNLGIQSALPTQPHDAGQLQLTNNKSSNGMFCVSEAANSHSGAPEPSDEACLRTHTCMESAHVAYRLVT